MDIKKVMSKWIPKHTAKTNPDWTSVKRSQKPSAMASIPLIQKNVFETFNVFETLACLELVKGANFFTILVILLETNLRINSL